MSKINIITRRDFLKHTAVLTTGASTITFCSSLLSCKKGDNNSNDVNVIRWSFIPDFPDIGDNHASMFRLFALDYDSSQSRLVSDFNDWNKVGAAWLRTSLPVMSREELISILPDVSQVTKAYVNNELVYKRQHPDFRHVPFPNPSEPEPIEIAQETNRRLLAAKIVEKLGKGGLVALKAEHWPDALPYHDIQYFSWHAEHGKQGTFLVIDSVRDDQSLDDWNIYYFLRNLADEAWPVKFRAQGEQVLNSYLNHKWEKTTPYAVKWVGPDGQHFGFINFSHEHWSLYAWLNPWMVDIVSNLVEWVQDSKIIVKVENSPRVVIEACEPLEKSSLLLVLINYSTDSYDNIFLSIASQFRDMKFAEIDANGKEHPVKIKYNGDRLHLQIKGSMPCLGVKYLVGR